jgi:hypothetical protein
VRCGGCRDRRRGRAEEGGCGGGRRLVEDIIGVSGCGKSTPRFAMAVDRGRGLPFGEPREGRRLPCHRRRTKEEGEEGGVDLEHDRCSSIDPT